jgi:hypothetical protein
MPSAQDIRTLTNTLHKIRAGVPKLAAVASTGLGTGVLQNCACAIKQAAIASQIPDAQDLRNCSADLLNLLGYLKRCDLAQYEAFVQSLQSQVFPTATA